MGVAVGGGGVALGGSIGISRAAGAAWAAAFASVRPAQTQAERPEANATCHQVPSGLRACTAKAAPGCAPPITGYAVPGPARRFAARSTTSRGPAGVGVADGADVAVGVQVAVGIGRRVSVAVHVGASDGDAVGIGASIGVCVLATVEVCTMFVGVKVVTVVGLTAAASALSETSNGEGAHADGNVAARMKIAMSQKPVRPDRRRQEQSVMVVCLHS